MMSTAKERRSVLLLGVVLGAVALAWLFPGLGDVGLAWDEAYYFDSVDRIQDWVGRVAAGPDRGEALSREAVRETFNWRRYYNPHPPLYKLAMAATEGAFGSRTGPVVGYRIAPLLAFALLVFGVTWVAGITWGRAAAAGAGLSLMLMPRVVGHAHIGATDTLTSLAWFVAAGGLVLYLTHGSTKYLVAGSVGLGAALATKFTGYLLPLCLLLWMIAYGRSRRAVGAAVLWGLGGLLVAWLLNPLMWHDPVAETLRLAGESLRREEIIPISTYYMGQQWGFRVPGHHPIVMTLITVPLSVLVLAAWGAAGGLRRWEERPVEGLCFTQVLFWMALLAAPGSPNHDGVRLWLPMFPFVALLAGRGFASVVSTVRRRAPERWLPVASLVLGALFFLPPYLQTVRVAPQYLAYYNELIGGPRGAQRAGMEATYWLEAVTPAFLERVEEVVPAGARLSAWPNVPHYEWLQARGMLRDDIVVTLEMPADYFVLVARKAVFQPHHWRIYRNVRPLLAVELDGVELAGLYAWTDATEPDPEEP